MTEVGTTDLLAEAQFELIEVASGLVSIPGPPGERGEAGATGPAGPQGDPGLPGESAYERAVAQGFVGDAAAWLASLQGPQGIAGAKGDKGEDGERGPQGERGEPGPAGRDGIDGRDGADGGDGADGAPGEPGPAGPAGAKGSDGTNGSDGAAGPAGPKGDVGPQGAQGPKGDKGDTGATGPAGPTGTNGAAPAGNEGAIQFRQGNSLAASGDALIMPDRQSLYLNGALVKGIAVAQKFMLSATGYYDANTPQLLGPHPGFYSTREWQPNGGGTTTVYNRAMTLVQNGTATTQAISNVRGLDEPTLNYVSAATAGSSAAFVNSNALVRSATARTGGFFVTIRLSIKGWSAGKKWYVGLAGDGAAPGTGEPSSQQNAFGFGVDTTDTTVQYMWRAGSGTAVRQDSGIPADLGGENVTFCFTCQPGSNIMVSGFNYGAYGYGTTCYDLPAGLCYPKAWVSNGAVAATITLSMNRAYVEYAVAA